MPDWRNRHHKSLAKRTLAGACRSRGRGRCGGTRGGWPRQWYRGHGVVSGSMIPKPRGGNKTIHTDAEDDTGCAKVLTGSESPPPPSLHQTKPPPPSRAPRRVTTSDSESESNLWKVMEAHRGRCHQRRSRYPRPEEHSMCRRVSELRRTTAWGTGSGPRSHMMRNHRRNTANAPPGCPRVGRWAHQRTRAPWQR